MDIESQKWCERFLGLAKVIASWSKDSSTGVGAVIVSDNGDPISFGFNGFPRGIHEAPELTERPNKYDFTEHAERNAIYLSRRDLRGTTMFVTHFPCPGCARGIVQSGITRLVVDSNYSNNLSKDSSIADPSFIQKRKNAEYILSKVKIIEQYTAKNYLEETNG